VTLKFYCVIVNFKDLDYKSFDFNIIYEKMKDCRSRTERYRRVKSRRFPLGYEFASLTDLLTVFNWTFFD